MNVTNWDPTGVFYEWTARVRVAQFHESAAFHWNTRTRTPTHTVRKLGENRVISRLIVHTSV